jgi:hypothetical protein
MVEKKSDNFLTYGLIAGGIAVAGVALWFLAGDEVDTDNLRGGKINQFDFEKVHTVERLRDILEEYSMDAATILIWSYNAQLKMKENDPEIFTKYFNPELYKDRSKANTNDQ